MNKKEYQQMKIDSILQRLSQSKFRDSFHLKQKDIDYIDRKKMQIIQEHAYEFINKRIAPQYIRNDGKQTPTKNHPVFISQHATATCCRGCLEKWHHIPKGRELTKEEIDYVVNVIMTYIQIDYNRNKKRP